MGKKMRGLYEDKQFWEGKWAREEALEREAAEEDSWREGESGEEYFDKNVLDAARGRDVIDIGCGRGEFTLAVAKVATRVVGIDFSEKAIAKALENGMANRADTVEFKLADARKIPYPDASLDLVFSRRGPATESLQTIREAYRVLRRGGWLVQQEIGERDKLNWKQVFRRGQNYPFNGRIVEEKERLLAEAGFLNINAREFEATEYFRTVKDVVIRLETTPIIPGFNENADRALVEKLERTCMDSKGIKTNEHRLIIAAKKVAERLGSIQALFSDQAYHQHRQSGLGNDRSAIPHSYSGRQVQRFRPESISWPVSPL